ncbi:MAG: hypothetical protein JO321_09960 [Solirubrobacterales bacterium]|nr:hypothetical protein [Solirubrobacterales bacterium]MBV9535721.1 hypothetical protein [Solirubrobacterales bacterium]
MTADVARFRPDDPDVLVSAAFACPVCLRSEQVRITPALEVYDPHVDCVCPSCSERWLVYLDPQQALRIGLQTARAAG